MNNTHHPQNPDADGTPVQVGDTLDAVWLEEGLGTARLPDPDPTNTRRFVVVHVLDLDAEGVDQSTGESATLFIPWGLGRGWYANPGRPRYLPGRGPDPIETHGVLTGLGAALPDWAQGVQPSDTGAGS